MRLSALRLFALRLYRSIWFLPSAYAAASVLVLALAPVFGELMPRGAERLLTAEALETILSILASSMLAVAIFSLGTMVSSLEAAASAATPRARVLLTQDRTAQRAISTFIGAFIFSILGIIGLSTGIYDAPSAACIFIATILMIIIVIVMLISWIKRLSEIGGVGEVVKLVEKATKASLADLANDPLYGGVPCRKAPEESHAVPLKRPGYVQYINAESLTALAEKEAIDLYLVGRPGDYYAEESPILHSSKPLEEEVLERARACFVIGDERTFEADPRFGLLTLSEIASRALSPAVNDPGTAIHSLDATVRVFRKLVQSTDQRDEKAARRSERLHVVPADSAAFIHDGFRAIARDGAAHREVCIHLQKSLAEVKSLDPKTFGEVAEDMSREAMKRAEHGGLFAEDLDALANTRKELGLKD